MPAHPKGVEAPKPGYGWPWVNIDGVKIRSLIKSLQENGFSYGYGSKIPLELQAHEDPEKKVDCSGCVRWLLYRATKSELTIPDGSAIQHEWFKSWGFKRSTPESARLEDGAIRIAFLSKQKSKSGIGHVVLIWNNRTFESHGSKGPNSRTWSELPWADLCDVYVLKPQ